MGRKPKSDEEAVFNRLESIRTKAKMSRQQLADAVDVHYQTIGYIERGEYAPTLALALRLSESLHCTIEELFQLKGEK